MTYGLTAQGAKSAVEGGMYASREAWGICRIIRNATAGDVDFINFPPEGVIVEDCKQRVCDCRISIYNPTDEDKEAKDWIIMTAEESK